MTYGVRIICILCGQDHVVKVPLEGLMRWRSGGGLIQHEMPELSIDQRELLISNMCPSHTDWGEDDDE